MPTTAERLTHIEGHLHEIVTLLSNRGAAVAQALADIEQTYGLTGQMAEVSHAQREQLEALIGRIDRLLAMLEAHDALLKTHDQASQEERGDIKALMVQLRELARKQVRIQEDLVKAVGAGDG